jgi:hypothetical protein
VSFRLANLVERACVVTRLSLETRSVSDVRNDTKEC